ncbi:MAG: hypothetical protein RO469_03105 [Thermincola sp.]|nr:hypothetical protein [Thermincola sp.]MDT3703176.1 hypothetical protein [Thermincola sp.]
MESIGILVFIVFMIFNLIGKISETKAKVPKERQGRKVPPVLRDIPVPWEMPYEAEEPDEVKYDPRTYPQPEVSVEPREHAIAEADRPKTSAGKLVTKAGGSIKQDPSFTGELLPLMDSTNIVNGLIVAELLKPPKCKRRIPKTF